MRDEKDIIKDFILVQKSLKLFLIEIKIESIQGVEYFTLRDSKEFVKLTTLKEVNSYIKAYRHGRYSISNKELCSTNEGLK